MFDLIDLLGIAGIVGLISFSVGYVLDPPLTKAETLYMRRSTGLESSEVDDHTRNG